MEIFTLLETLEEILDQSKKIPFTDKADAQIIKERFDMSKNAFKRAVGRLLKEGKIEITQNSILLKK